MKTLEEIGRELRARMGKGATEPLVVAGEVVKLAAQWSTKYRAEARGASCASWLKKVFGKGKNLAWFKRRHEAVQLIGEHARRTWDHDAAVWVLGKLKDSADVRRLDEVVQKATRKNGGNPLTLTMVRSLAKEHKIATTVRFSKCVRCTELELALLKANVPIPR